MHNRSSKPKRSRDENEMAFSILEELERRTEDKGDAKSNGHEKNPAAVALGRLGGKKGGPARAQALSAEKKKEIALKAARARWAKKTRSK